MNEAAIYQNFMNEQMVIWHFKECIFIDIELICRELRSLVVNFFIFA